MALFVQAGVLSPGKSDAASQSQLLTHTRSLSLDDETRVPSGPGNIESGACKSMCSVILHTSYSNVFNFFPNIVSHLIHCSQSN